MQVEPQGTGTDDMENNYIYHYTFGQVHPNPNPNPSPSPNPNPNSSPNPNPNPNQAQAALAQSDRVTGGVAAVGGPAYCFDTRPVGEYQLPPRYQIGAGITPPVAVQHMRRSAGEMAYQEAAEHRLA